MIDKLTVKLLRVGMRISFRYGTVCCLFITGIPKDSGSMTHLKLSSSIVAERAPRSEAFQALKYCNKALCAAEAFAGGFGIIRGDNAVAERTQVDMRDLEAL